MKTLYSKSPDTLIDQLTKGATQSDRLIVNIVGNITARDAGDAIKTFYKSHKEIKVLTGGKEIDINFDVVIKKNFTQTFMDRWSK
jgi:hypothetical protein